MSHRYYREPSQPCRLTASLQEVHISTSRSSPQHFLVTGLSLCHEFLKYNWLNNILTDCCGSIVPRNSWFCFGRNNLSETHSQPWCQARRFWQAGPWNSSSKSYFVPRLLVHNCPVWFTGRFLVSCQARMKQTWILSDATRRSCWGTPSPGPRHHCRL